MFKRFLHNAKGTTAMIFAIAFIPTIGAMGIALDYMRASMAHSRLQASVDSAALAVGASDSSNTKKLQALIESYIDANGSGMPGFEIKKIKRTSKGESDVTVHVEATLDTLVMRILGIDELDISATTSVARTINQHAEIAMVLDTTGSMLGSKLATLKTAAKQLIADTLKSNKEDSDGGDAVKIGIVPFAQYVNVGVSRRNESWISVPPDTKKSKFYGCVGSRNYPDNVSDGNYGSKPVPGLMDVTCVTEITDLTKDQSKLEGAVDALNANGWTYIGAGLGWGWRLLSADAPFTKGIAYEDMDQKKFKTKKFLILMTDGENTRAPSYPKHDSTSNALANKLTAEMCTNIKALDIKIFTVAFEVTDPTTINLLADCASSDSYAFDAKDSTALLAAFKSISNQISMLRLAE